MVKLLMLNVLILWCLFLAKDETPLLTYGASSSEMSGLKYSLQLIPSTEEESKAIAEVFRKYTSFTQVCYIY